MVAELRLYWNGRSGVEVRYIRLMGVLDAVASVGIDRRTVARLKDNLIVNNRETARLSLGRSSDYDCKRD